jgi:hypothetical protein
MGKACCTSATTGNSETGLTVQAASLTNSEKLKVATVVEQMMTELSGAFSEEDKIMVLNETKMAARVYRPLNIVAFNANGICKQHYELS